MDPVHVLTARPLVRHSLVEPFLSTDGLVDPGFVLDARLIIANVMDQNYTRTSAASDVSSSQN
jgi:hypothetical protein